MIFNMLCLAIAIAIAVVLICTPSEITDESPAHKPVTLTDDTLAYKPEINDKNVEYRCYDGVDVEYVKRIDENGNAYTKELIHDPYDYDKVSVTSEYGPISPEKQLECRRNLEYDDWIRRGCDGEPITKEEYDTFGIKWYFNKYDEKCLID